MKRRVVITGTGVVSSLGIGTGDFWESIKNGQSGISKIERVDVSDLPTCVGAEIKNYDPSEFIGKKEIKRMDRFTQFAVSAAHMAIEDSKLNIDTMDKGRLGIVIGTGIGGIETMESQHKILMEKGPGRVSPFFVPLMLPNIAAANIAIRYGVKGFVECVTTACASSANSIGDAFKVIQRNDADVMIAGGAEAPIVRLSLSGFCANKTMTTNKEPLSACRPFDAQRDGFVIGEGAGALILEEYEHAIKRGANIIAEIVGYGCSNDAYHITAIPDDGEGGAKSILQAINDAGILPSDINYINAHGTSTELNDKSETAAIKTVFGEYAYRLPISSTKSMTGHLLGAAGAVESIITVLALKDGYIPPTINYSVPDPECDLDYVPNVGRKKDISYALTNSFGFGGHNATLIFKKVK